MKSAENLPWPSWCRQVGRLTLRVSAFFAPLRFNLAALKRKDAKNAEARKVNFASSAAGAPASGPACCGRSASSCRTGGRRSALVLNALPNLPIPGQTFPA